MLARETTPSAIVKYLDQYVIGQEEAKKVVAVAVYSHYRKIATCASDRGTIAKSNVLLVGPSGTGKTLLCDTLSRMLKVPFVTADATSLAQTKYVNEEIEAVLQRLVDKADGKIENAQHGIIFIDEIDKLKANHTQSGAISGESVQHALLKIMEGSPVKLRDDHYIDTSNILFICGGAFVGIENIMAKTHGFGFIATSADDNQNILDRLNKRVKPTDLFEFGLIPEFTGRLPVIANLHALSKAMLVRIMSVPKNSIYRQYIEIFRGEGVDLRIGPKVFEQIAEIAIEYKTGARSLRGIFEELITPILYVVPDHPEIARVEISSLFEALALSERNEHALATSSPPRAGPTSRSRASTAAARAALRIALLVCLIALAGVSMFQDKLLYFPEPASVAEMETASGGLAPWPTAPDFRGLLAEPDGQARATAIIFHGNAGHAGHRRFYVDVLARHGLRVILAEYPAYGPRPGEVGEKSLVADADQTLLLAHRMYGGPLLIIGESLGAGVAAAASAARRELIAGLLLITPWDRLASVAAHHYPLLPVQWLLRDRYDSVAHLASFGHPVLVVIAARDSIVPPQFGRALFAALTEPKRLAVIDGAEHNDWFARLDDAWWRQAIDFLLAGSERSSSERKPPAP